MSTEAQAQLERIQSNVAAAYAAAEEQGADMPETQTTDNLAETIGSIKSVKFTPQDLDAEKQAQARQNIGAIGTDELDTALEEALTEAKESGEFDGASGVYTLGEGETLEDAPEDASVVIDPDGTPTTEKWVFTLADGSTVERTVYLA